MTGPQPLLSGLRVVEVTDESVAYAGRLLADLGAEVIVVEPPGGSSVRRKPPLTRTPRGDVSLYWSWVGAGKRSVTLDLPSDDEVLHKLLSCSDAVIVTPATAEPGSSLEAESLADRHPHLVVTSSTPFGLSGVRKHWVGSDLIAWASSGILPSIGDPDRPPVAPVGDLANFTSALNVAIGTLLAVRAARNGAGGQIVDISAQEAMLGVSMEVSVLQVLDGGYEMPRTGSRRPFPPIGHYPTSDGAVAIVGFMPEHWDALAQWICEETGIQDVTNEAFRGTPMNRGPFVDVLDPWIEALTSRYTKQKFFLEAQARGIPVTPVNSMADVADDPHLDAVGAWTDVDVPDLGPLRLPRGPFRIDGHGCDVRPSPAVGEHNEAVFADELQLDSVTVRRLLTRNTEV